MMHTVLPMRTRLGALRVVSGTRRSPDSSCRGRSAIATASAPVVPLSTADFITTFTDHRNAYEQQNTGELFRSLLVLRLCTLPAFVQHVERLLLGAQQQNTGAAGTATTATAATAPQWLRDALYAHFSAGAAPAEVWARMNCLRAHGVGAILEFAQEPASVAYASSRPRSATAATSGGRAVTAAPSTALRHVHVHVHVHAEAEAEAEAEADAAAEAECDARLESFLASIDTAAALPGTGFAAVQLSALCAPGLLQALAAALGRLHALFAEGAAAEGDGGCWVTRRDFGDVTCGELACGRVMTGGPGEAHWPPPVSMGGADTAGDDGGEGEGGMVDYVSWCRTLELRHLARLGEALVTSPGAGSNSSRSSSGASDIATSLRPLLIGAQRRQLESLQARLERLVGRAEEQGVKLLFGGEADAGEPQTQPKPQPQQLLRPALEHVVHGLMRRHNRRMGPGQGQGEVPEEVQGSEEGWGGAVMFLAYDAALPDTPRRLSEELARAEREGYTLGAQLVGGPAPSSSSPSPSPESACLALLLGAVRAGWAEVMVSSHSRVGVEAAVESMSGLGLCPDSAPVYFGQMLGLADSISFGLGAAGYRVYKHCPLGDVDKVLPYLVRRVRQTQAMMQASSSHELSLVQSELWRRLVAEPAEEMWQGVAAAAATLRAGGRKRAAGGGGGSGAAAARQGQRAAH